MYTNNLFTLNNIPTLAMPNGVCNQSPMSDTERLAMNDTDKILVSINKYGREIASMQVTGYVSIEGILSSLARTFTGQDGLLTVRLRNPRCGWMVKRSILTGRRRSQNIIASA